MIAHEPEHFDKPKCRHRARRLGHLSQQRGGSLAHGKQREPRRRRGLLETRRAAGEQKEVPEGAQHGALLRGGRAEPPYPTHVQALDRRSRGARCEAIRQEVVEQDGGSGDEGASADRHTLVDASMARHLRSLADGDVSCEGRARGQHHARPDGAVVSDVHVRHDQTVVADRSQPAAARRAAAHMRMRVHGASSADPRVRGLAAVLEVLRAGANGGEGENLGPLPDGRVPRQDDLRAEYADMRA